MDLTKFKPTTAGEHLFHLLLRELVDEESYRHLATSPILDLGGRAEELSDYMLGVTTLNFLARLIKKALRVLAMDDATLHHGAMTQYLLETVGLAQRRDDLHDRVARMALDAAKNSQRPVNNSSKKVVREGRFEVPCYLCGNMCAHDNADTQAIKYEHIWPSSYGGNSAPENLLPACELCNEQKKDMLLWHTGSLFSFVLKPEPSEEERKSIQRREKIARSIQDVLREAVSSECTLKEAALALGPADFKSVTILNAADAVDYFNFNLSRRSQ